MPDKGLLHSGPGNTITSELSDLDQLLHQCIAGTNDRFVTVDLLLQLFNKVLLN